jgi:glycosyltransferase involved in cell wall biosynthesis
MLAQTHDKSKKVVLLGVEPFSLVNFRRDLLKELVREGHKVTAVAMNPSTAQIAVLQELGVDVLSIEFSRAGMNPWRDLKTMLRLRQLFSKLGPDLVIGYTAKPVIYGAIAASLARVPNFCAMVTGLGYSFIEGGGLKRKIAYLSAKFLYRVALKQATSVIFQNPDDLATFRKLELLNTKASIGIVNGSGVDLDHFKICALPQQPVFLMIARLLADKGIREFAEAAVQLRKEFPNAQVYLAGSLDPSPNSVSQIELDSWVKDGIKYLGHVDDVRTIISQASIIVLPSYREGTPRSVLEGMAMGRAIITTDAPGCRETVQHGINGLLVKPRDSVALFEAMKSLAQNQNRVEQMGKAAHKMAQEKYEGKAVARSVLKLAGILV